MEHFCELELFLRAGPYSLRLLELWKLSLVVAQLSHWAWGCARPEPFHGCSPLSFLCSVVLPNLRICVCLRGPVFTGRLRYWTMFPSTSRKVFIFLIIVGWGQSLVLHGVHFVSCIVLSLLKICISCMEVTFTSTSTTSAGSQHLK